ncbi:MAG: hypothetical protein B7Y39_00235 [Bdellovibrio sp. 28-41-41]|nr:MAG: hypothetical protein B7Y39_00235 [Bdellovibrio sp. 28-41-41]
MKLIAMLFMVLPLFSLAQEKPILNCQSPSHTFHIKQSMRSQPATPQPAAPKKFIGTLLAPSQKPQVLDCVEKGMGFACKKGDFVAKVLRGSVSGRTIVQLELEGEYDVESGYLGTIYCR